MEVLEWIYGRIIFLLRMNNVQDSGTKHFFLAKKTFIIDNQTNYKVQGRPTLKHKYTTEYTNALQKAYLQTFEGYKM